VERGGVEREKGLRKKKKFFLEKTFPHLPLFLLLTLSEIHCESETGAPFGPLPSLLLRSGLFSSFLF